MGNRGVEVGIGTNFEGKVHLAIELISTVRSLKDQKQISCVEWENPRLMVRQSSECGCCPTDNPRHCSSGPAALRQRVVAAFHSFRPVLAANEGGRSCLGGDARIAWKCLQHSSACRALTPADYCFFFRATRHSEWRWIFAMGDF